MPCRKRSQPGDDRKPVGLYLAILAAVSFFNYMDRMVLAVIAQPLKAEMRLGDAQIGMLSGFAFSALFAIAGIPIARLADRSDRVRLLSISIEIWSAATALTGIARTLPQLFGARMAVGLGEAGCLPASHSLIGDYLPQTHRGWGISVFQGGGILGLSAGLILTSYLTQTFGVAACLGWNRAGWRAAGAPDRCGYAESGAQYRAKFPVRLGMDRAQSASWAPWLCLSARSERHCRLRHIRHVAVGRSLFYAHLPPVASDNWPLDGNSAGCWRCSRGAARGRQFRRVDAPRSTMGILVASHRLQRRRGYSSAYASKPWRVDGALPPGFGGLCTGRRGGCGVGRGPGVCQARPASNSDCDRSVLDILVRAGPRAASSRSIK